MNENTTAEAQGNDYAPEPVIATGRMYENIPEELQAIGQWVGATPDKRPYSPTTGKLASVTDPTTWGTFEEAVNAGYPHIGLVLTVNDPYCIIDLDNKPTNPCTPEQWQRHVQILETCVSYTERSASGSGYHIVLKGSVPKGVHRDNVEIYSSARYMIFTGDVVRNAPISDEYQHILNAMYSQMAPQVTVELSDEDDGEEVISDADLVDMASAAVNGDKFDALCAGQWEEMGYPSQSEADHALLSMLAFYTKSNEQVRRLFRMTALGKRDKATRNNKYLNYSLQKIRAQEPPPVDLSALHAQPTPAQCPAPTQPPSPAATAPNTACGAPETPGMEALPFPPGMVGEIALFIYRRSVRPVPEVAVVAALGLVAGIAGRAFCTSQPPTGLNLYLILLGKTGIGKEGGKQGIKALLNEVRKRVPAVMQFEGPTSFASGQALLKRFNEQPCFYAVLGEIGHLLKRITSPKASQPDQALQAQFLELYSQSGPDGVLGVHAHSDKEKNTTYVRGPSLTIVGESTQETFFEATDNTVVQNGLIPRFLLVEYSGSRPPRNRHAGVPPSDELVGAVANFAEIALRAEQTGTFTPVQFTPEAVALFDSFDVECDRSINNGSSTEAELWNRAHLNALRVASVIAVGDNPNQPSVSLDAARWAIEFVRRSVHTVQSRFDKGEVGGGPAAKAEAETRRVVNEYLNMPPEKRATYKTAKSLQTGPLIPERYVRERLKHLQPFRGEKNPISWIDQVLKMLVDEGALQVVPAEQAQKEFNIPAKIKTKLYVRGENW